jgi:hypothetical protein
MPEIDNSTASIRFSGEGLQEDEIPKLLKLKDYEGTRLRQNYKKIGKKGLWGLGFAESDETGLEGKIQFLLNQFTGDIQTWNDVTARYKGDIFCSLFLDGWNRGFELSAELLREIGARNLEIGFDIYSATDTWVPSES